MPPPTHAATEQIAFETHEWEKHGKCAGVVDATDFFTQLCALASATVAVMTKSRSAGKTASADFAADLTSAGFPVFGHDDQYGQVELTACLDTSGKWHVTPQSSFTTTCGGSGPAPGPAPGPSPAPTPGPSPAPSGGKCVPNTHGPACKSDSDCALPGCVRCAHSGFCTDVPQAPVEAAYS